MKGKKFYLILIALVAIGVGSVFIYRQQQETRALEFEGYEISAIEKRVDALYNKDKTDIKENISGELDNLGQILTELEEKDLSARSESRIGNMIEQFSVAKKMYELQEEVANLFKEESIVYNNTSLEMIEALETSLEEFKDKTHYYERNINYIADARVQIETVEEATKLVEKLSIDSESAEEELKTIEELIKQIKDEDVKARLIEQIEAARLALKETEEEITLDEEDDLEEEILEEIDEQEIVQEEGVEEEGTGQTSEQTIEIVQETARRPEQTSTIPDRNSNRPNKNLAPANSNQSQAKSSSSQSNQQSSSQIQEPPAAEPTTTEPPSTPSRPAVAEIKQETEEKEIPFTTRRNQRNDLEEGTEIVYFRGSNGRKKVTYEIINYTNGTSSKKVISEEVIVLPTTRIVDVGTKPSSVGEEPSEDENE